MAVNQTAVAALLGLSMSAFWLLTSNSQFPAPVSDDGQGNVTWNTSDITAFQGLMGATASNGWTWGDVDLPGANWIMMASTPVGPYYRQALSDGLTYDTFHRQTV
jgi:predicted DNA-binding transcriptional regulator AlpA